MPVDSKPSKSSAPPPIVALVGADPFLQVEALHELQERLPEAQRTDYEGDYAELADVLDAVRSFSMFSSWMLVVVRNADDFVSLHRERLEDFVRHVEEHRDSVTGTLVLRLSSFPGTTRLHKAVVRVGEVIKCEAPSDAGLSSWIARRAKTAHQVGITPPAATALADLIGADLGRLDSELGRLALLVPDPPAPQVITPEVVQKSVAFQREQEVKDITALLGRGRVEEALVRWRHLLMTDAAAEYKAATWLMIWLEKARTALDLRDKGVAANQMSRALWINDPAELKDFLEVASRLGRSGIADRLARLTEVDRRIKTGLGKAEVLIERFMATAVPTVRG